MTLPKISKIFIVSGFLLVVGVSNVQASYIQNIAKEGFGDTGYDAAQADTVIYEKIGDFVAIFLQAVAVVLVIVIIYAGWLWLTAGGNDDQVTKARKWMTNAVIGMVIIGVAYLITGFVIESVFPQSEGIPSSESRDAS